MCTAAATAGSVRGIGLWLSSSAVGLSVELGCEHVNWKGYRCWIARSRVSLLVFTLAPLTTPSHPLMSFVTTASFHWFRFFLSSWIMTTSQMCGWLVWFPPAWWCVSWRLWTYSGVHRFHMTSLHVCRNLALFLKSFSGRWYGCSLGRWFESRCSMEFGVHSGSWISSSR